VSAFTFARRSARNGWALIKWPVLLLRLGSAV